MPLPPSRTRTPTANPLSHDRILRVCTAYRVLYDAFIAQGGQLTPDLYAATLEVDRERIYWEQRASRLRHSAKRQAAYRAEQRAFADDDDDLIAPPQPDLAQAELPLPEPAPDLPPATRQALERFKHSDETERDKPDTSDYKRSGLI